MATDVQTTPQAPLTAAGLLGLLGGGYQVPQNPLAALGDTTGNSVGANIAALIPGFDASDPSDAFKGSQLIAALAGMGQGFLAAGEPSRFPVPRGRAMGLAFTGALQGMSGAATAALQNKLTGQEITKNDLANAKTSVETRQIFDQANAARLLAGQPQLTVPMNLMTAEERKAAGISKQGGLVGALSDYSKVTQGLGGPTLARPEDGPQSASRPMGIVPQDQLRAQADALLAAPSTSAADDPLPPAVSDQRQVSTPLDVGARYPYLPESAGVPHGTPDGVIDYPKASPLTPEERIHTVGAILAKSPSPERDLAVAQGAITSHDVGELYRAIGIASNAGKPGEARIGALMKQLETELAQRASSRRYDPGAGVYGDTPTVMRDKASSALGTTAGNQGATFDANGKMVMSPGAQAILEGSERRKLLGMAPNEKVFWNPATNAQVSVDMIHNPGLVEQLVRSGYQPMGADEKRPDVSNTLTARAAASTKIGDQGGIPTFGPTGQPTGSQPIGNVGAELTANANDTERLKELSTRQDTLLQARQSIDHLKVLIGDPSLKTGRVQEASEGLRKFIYDWAPNIAPGVPTQQAFAAAVVNSLGPLRSTLGVQQVRGPEISFLEKAAAGGIGDTLPAIRANTLALEKQIGYGLNQISHVQSEKEKGVHVSDSLKSYSDNTPNAYSSPETKAAIQSTLDPSKLVTPRFDNPAQLRDWAQQHADYLTVGQMAAAEKMAKMMEQPSGPNQTGKPYPVVEPKVGNRVFNIGSGGLVPAGQ